MSNKSSFHNTSVIVVIIIMSVICFGLGMFYEQLKSTKHVKNETPEWYQEQIMSFVANPIMKEFDIDKKLKHKQEFKVIKPNPTLKKKAWKKTP